MSLISDTLKDSRFANIALLVGTLYGIFFKQSAANFFYISKLYVSVLSITVIPLIVTRITLAIMDLILNKEKGKSLGGIRIILTTIILSVLFAVISIGVVLIFKPWVSLIEKPEVLRIVYEREPLFQPEISLSTPILNTESNSNFADLLQSLVPYNIFNSLSEGKIVNIIVFFILFALSTVVLTRDIEQQFKATLENFQKIFENLSAGILQFVPIFSFFVAAYQISLISNETLVSLKYFLLCLLAIVLSSMSLSILIVFTRSKQPFAVVLGAMGKCMRLAFLSNSTIVASTMATNILINDLKFARDKTKLIMSIGAGILKFGVISFYCVPTIVAAFLFNVQLSPLDYVTIIGLSIFVMLISTEVLSYSNFLFVIMEPFNLPATSMQPIMISLRFFTDPFILINNVLGICALAALCCEREESITDTKSDNK